jgi:tripartite-type tricarboxylate transporter receptor subunit TctC
LSIHSTEDTIPHEAVPVEMEIRAVDKDFRVKSAAQQKSHMKRKKAMKKYNSTGVEREYYV